MRARNLLLLSLALIAVAFLGGLPKAEAQNLQNHYKCYDIVQPVDFVPRTVTLRDQFGTTTATVRRPLQLCTPVSKNNEVVPNPQIHLVCYEIAETPVIGPKNVRTNDQFGTLTYTIRNPNRLCVPANKTVLP